MPKINSVGWHTYHHVVVAAFLEASTTYSSDSNPNLMISVIVKGAQMLRRESYKP
jgi:hypothetical protein